MSVQEKSIFSFPISPEHFLELARVWNPSYFNQKGDSLYSLVERIETLPPTEHLPTEVVTFACGLSIGWQLPFALIEHEKNYSIQEKTAILLRERDTILAQLGTDGIPVLPLKTVTLGVEHEGSPKYFLFTRIGDFPLDGQTKRDIMPVIKQLLNTETNVMNRGVKINPPEFDPVKSLGINRGIVSPFVMTASLTTGEKEPTVDGYLSGLLYYQDKIEGFVAIAVSPRETIIIKRSIFMFTLNWWQESHLVAVKPTLGFIPTVPFRRIIKS